MVYFHIWNLLFVIYYNIALECDDISCYQIPCELHLLKAWTNAPLYNLDYSPLEQDLDKFLPVHLLAWESSLHIKEKTIMNWKRHLVSFVINSWSYQRVSFPMYVNTVQILAKPKRLDVFFISWKHPKTVVFEEKKLSLLTNMK